MRYGLHTEIEIEAEPAEVWRHLTDVARYHEWNPFIISGAGTVAVGERLKLRLDPPGARGITLRPTVTEVEPLRTFEWLGHVGIPGIFDGRHRFELVPTESGTKVVQSETFRGVLVRLMRRSLDGATRDGFEAMNGALASRATAAHAPA